MKSTYVIFLESPQSISPLLPPPRNHRLHRKANKHLGRSAGEIQGVFHSKYKTSSRLVQNYPRPASSSSSSSSSSLCLPPHFPLLLNRLCGYVTQSAGVSMEDSQGRRTGFLLSMRRRSGVARGPGHSDQQGLNI